VSLRLCAKRLSWCSEGNNGLPENRKEQFQIHASVVFQLGESLITDSVQALLELVKNSYDADASYCKVTIDTGRETAAQTAFPQAVGTITVEDDGTGMSLADIRRGWLTISDSSKREFKAKKLVTAKGRTPLGDKGLGRLGTQRLGDNLEIFTGQGNDSQIHVAFSWNDFRGKKLLSEVDIVREEISTASPRGTKIIVSGLRNLEVWMGQPAVNQLQEGLSQMISPFTQIRTFTVYVKVDGKELDLIEVGSKLRNSALLTYSFTSDGAHITINGKAKLAYLKPEKGKKEKVIFADLAERDDGKALYNFLAQLKAASMFRLKPAKAAKWFVEFSKEYSLDDVAELDVVEGQLASPGPFSGEVDFYSFGSESLSSQTVFSHADDYKQRVQALSGIRVYRDGFGIRVARDWLELGQQWTGATSYYGLKPQTTIGYVAITAKDNAKLEEKTDREGFSDNAYYRAFYALLRSVVIFSGDAQAFLRRGWTEFKKEHIREEASVSPSSTPEDLSASISSTVGRASIYRLSLSKISTKLQNSAESSAEILKAFQQSRDLTAGERKTFQVQLGQLLDYVTEAKKLTAEVDAYLQEIWTLEKVGTVLTQQIETLISLGMTAEALSHEINNAASHLAEKNEQIIRYLKGSGPKDPKLVAYTEIVKSTIGALRRELTYLAPSLQYVRERREDIEIRDFLSDMFKHHLPVFSENRIALHLSGDKDHTFRVHINRGKLIQIIDNLLFNSQYWLKEDMRVGRISLGRIDLLAEKPFVKVSDNGRGVDPVLEDNIFEPFVSAKGKGRGRGLGLYIVQQLLESEGCSIRLLPDRNRFDRRVAFELNLRGILAD
jgi:signal transduction histidine kinase